MIFVVAQKVSGIAVKDLGEGPVRPATPYFEPKLRPEGPKKFFGDRAPSLSQVLDDHPQLPEGLNPPMQTRVGLRSL